MDLNQRLPLQEGVRLISFKEASRVTGLSRDALFVAIDKGSVCAEKLNGVRYITVESVQKWLEGANQAREELKAREVQRTMLAKQREEASEGVNHVGK
jgi:hypothetical protein